MSAGNCIAENIPVTLLNNIHVLIEPPSSNISIVRGNYLYYHYGLENRDDRGWGCGYRTLQSLCSWVRNQLLLKTSETACGREPAPTPSIQEIQEALVAMGDKEEMFKGSKTWIGSFEVCLCLDHFYDVPCKIAHVRSGQNLSSHVLVDDLVQHFKTFGSPVMMGGDKDSSSKGILGICTEPMALLVMDPHFYSKDGTASQESLVEGGYIKWTLLEEFDKDSFYNLCLPQLKAQ